MSKFYELKKGAEKAQQRKAINEHDAIAMSTDYFLKSGIDYKGQFQCCYDAKGGGGEVQVSVDPAAFFNPFMHTQLTLSATTSLAKERMIVTQRGPSLIGEYSVPMPILINCLIGWDVTASIRGDLELSIGASFSLGPNSSADSAKIDTQENFKEKGLKYGEFECDFENAGLNFEASAKAGFKAGVGYSYEHFFAIDCAPIPFASNDKENVRGVLGGVWQTGSYKSALKIQVMEFLNKHAVLWQDEGERPARYQVGHIIDHRHDSSARFCEILDRIITNPLLDRHKHPEYVESSRKISGMSSRRIKKLALAYRNALNVWVDKDNQPAISTFLAISCHKVEGDVGLFAKAGVSADGTFVHAEVGADVTGPTVSGSYKHANTRYQAVYPGMNNQTGEATEIVMTQETRIIYKTFDLTFVAVEVSAKAGGMLVGEVEAKAGVKASLNKGLSASASAQARTGVIRGGGIMRGGAKEKEESKSIGEGHLLTNLNRITYESTTIFWSEDNLTKALPGTGYSVGGSFLIKNLIALWEDINDHGESGKKVHIHHLNAGSKRYIANIAQSLKIRPHDVLHFFEQLTKFDVEFYFENTLEALGCEAILLEASFRVDDLELLNMNPLTDIDSARTTINLDSTASKRILEIPFGAEKHLESIKLRYRIQDTHDYSTSLFKLGINVTGVGGSIALKKVHKAGSEGIVDLMSVWLQKGKIVDGSIESDDIYDKAVPPVVLFCQ
jgi:hypothetical protein